MHFLDVEKERIDIFPADYYLEQNPFPWLDNWHGRYWTGDVDDIVGHADWDRIMSHFQRSLNEIICFRGLG